MKSIPLPIKDLGLYNISDKKTKLGFKSKYKEKTKKKKSVYNYTDTAFYNSTCPNLKQQHIFRCHLIHVVIQSYVFVNF